MWRGGFGAEKSVDRSRKTGASLLYPLQGLTRPPRCVVGVTFCRMMKGEVLKVGILGVSLFLLPAQGAENGSRQMCQRAIRRMESESSGFGDKTTPGMLRCKKAPGSDVMISAMASLVFRVYCFSKDGLRI